MKLLSEFQYFPKWEAEALFNSILLSIIDLKHKFIIKHMKVNANAVNPPGPKGTIIKMILRIQPANPLQQVIPMFPNGHQLLANHNNTKFLIRSSNFLETIKLLFCLIREVIYTWLVS